LSAPPQLVQFEQKFCAKTTHSPEFQSVVQQDASAEHTSETHGWQLGSSFGPAEHGLCAQLPPPPEELLLVAEMELETTELASWLLDAPPPLATAEAAPPVPPVDCVLAPPLPELALPPALLLVSSSMPLCVPLAAHAALMTSERNANRWCWVGDMITAIMP
jgi:hypothetical protein